MDKAVVERFDGPEHFRIGVRRAVADYLLSEAGTLGYQHREDLSYQWAAAALQYVGSVVDAWTPDEPRLERLARLDIYELGRFRADGLAPLELTPGPEAAQLASRYWLDAPRETVLERGARPSDLVEDFLGRFIAALESDAARGQASVLLLRP